MPEETAADLREAARRFFPGPRVVVPLGRSSGFSGSAFARIEAAGGVWCLRRWPAAFPADRLRFIHRALIHSRARGFSGVPALATTAEGETILDLDGALFDAQEWLAGEPWGGRPDWGGPAPNVARALPPDRLAALAGGLARFHRSTVGLRAPSAAWRRPLTRWLAGAGADLAADAGGLAAAVRERAEGAEQALALRWLDLLPEAVALAEVALRGEPAGARDATTLCHGDLWAPHVHFTGSTLRGFVDFEGLAFSSPAIDLAQVILHFNGWPARDRILQHYQAVVPLDDSARRVLPAAAALDLADEARWAIAMLHGEGSDPAQRAAHAANLRALLPSLEAVIGELRRGGAGG